jgi:hypothetical protein
MGTPEGHKKSIFNTLSLQAQHKTIKNYQNTKSTNRNKKISNKSMFSTSKVKISQKFV